MKKHIITINIIVYIVKSLIFLLLDEMLEMADIALESSILLLIVLLFINGVYMFHDQRNNGWKICLIYIGMTILETVIVSMLMTNNLISDHIGFMGLGSHRIEYYLMKVSNIASCIILVIVYVMALLFH